MQSSSTSHISSSVSRLSEGKPFSRGFPTWSVVDKESARGSVHDLEFYYATTLVGRAKVVLFTAREDDLDVLEGLASCDIFCVQEDLEAWLLGNPGSYAWIDSLERCNEAPEVRGKLTNALLEFLSSSAWCKAQPYTGLLFPCPYGGGDDPSDEGRVALRQWYQMKLRAKEHPGSALLTFDLN